MPLQSASPSFPEAVVYLALVALVAGTVLAAAVALPRRASRRRGAGLLLLSLLIGAILLVPDDRRSLAAAAAWPLGVAAALFALSLRGILPGGGPVRKGASLFVFASGGAVVLVTASIAYLTGSYAAFSGETLAALVEVTPTRFQAPYTHRTERAEVTYRAGTEAVEVSVATLDGDRGAFHGRFLLPGDSWGLGGRILEIDRFYFLFGKKTYFRVTDVHARFRGRPTEPHYGEPLSREAPEIDSARLSTRPFPFGSATLGELFGAESRSLDEYDAVVYPVASGRYFAVYAKSAGGFVPRTLDAAEWRELVSRHFDADPFARPEI